MSSNWSTNNELEFIEEMLSRRPIFYRDFIVTREKLLVNYIICAKKRKENGLTPNVDWDECIELAEKHLYETIKE